MNQLPRITEIIKVEPFKVTCRWSTGEVRVIDFEPIFQEWRLSESKAEVSLLEYENFKYVSVSEQKTLHWVNVLTTHKYWNESGDSDTRTSPLTYDANVLYDKSQPLERYRLVPIPDTQQAA
ncbi:hypothetical protein [Spirosoma linguale]|uniref:Uncharacterized protein n=1 Tax=Spirosoma linguale (strain ATCC 33905 / DSM 74 / LMG 10896 / Claus 1) TaxID=504472 RepID=D2QK20_SPILD|nr:hypothetical protein Slin_1091 [Spirosoma linguale DSM 74]